MSLAALCKTCGKPQPTGWRAGELCVWCGGAVRDELRCSACARWTPGKPGGFCRHCGAELVASADWGVTRILLRAGG